MPHQLIRFNEGDVLGLYFPEQSPLAWSSVPCSRPEQRHRVGEPPPGGSGVGGAGLRVGGKVRFSVGPPGENACRQYSFTAVLSGCTHLYSILFCSVSRISLYFFSF